MPATNVKSQWVGGDLYFYDGSGNEICHFDGTNRKLSIPSGSLLSNDNGPMIFNQRIRTTLANVNAGANLLPAIPGYKYRLIDTTVIAIGGAAAALTLLTIGGTQGASGVNLVTHTQATLLQSAALKPNSTGAAVLADGASFVQNDVNTAITIGKTGSSMTTATNIDVIITYAVEA